MSTSAQPSIRPLSVPMNIGRCHISVDTPGGQPARDSEEFEALRSEFFKLSRVDAPAVDWAAVCELAINILGRRGKDLQTLVYFVRGLTEQYGYRGLDIGLKITNDLLIEHWDRCHPGTDKGRSRAQILGWISESLTPRLEKMPPTKAETQSLHRALEQVTDLEFLLQQRLGTIAPSLGHLRRLLADYCGKLPLLSAINPKRKSVPAPQPPAVIKPRELQSAPAIAAEPEPPPQLTLIETSQPEPEASESPTPPLVVVEKNKPLKPLVAGVFTGIAICGLGYIALSSLSAPAPMQAGNSSNVVELQALTNIAELITNPTEAAELEAIQVKPEAKPESKPGTEIEWKPTNVNGMAIETPLATRRSDKPNGYDIEFVPRSREATRELLKICETVPAMHAASCKRVANELFALSRESYNWNYSFLSQHIAAGEWQIARQALVELQQRLQQDQKVTRKIFEPQIINEAAL